MALRAHHWPGNLRELHNALKVAAALSDGDRIDAEALPEQIGRPGAGQAFRPAPSPLPPVRTRDDDGPARPDDLLRELAACGGNVSALARRLGVNRSTVHRWLKRGGLRPG